MKALSIVSALFVGGLASITTLSAQEGYREPLPQRGALVDGKTIVKTNPISDIFGFYNLSGERILSKRFSVELGLGFSPLSRRIYEAQKFSNFVTLNFEDYEGKTKAYGLSLGAKLYVSKTGYGHGFYFRSDLSYGAAKSYGSQSILLKSLNVANIERVNTRRSSSIGLGIGAQWLIGKRRNIVLDWNILNIHRTLSFKDRSVYTLYGNKPFSIEDSGEIARVMTAQRLGVFGVVLLPFIGQLEPAEPYQNGQVLRETMGVAHNISYSMNLSIGFRF